MVAMFTTDQAAFRLYDSDAGEAASTPLENQDVNHTLTVDANTSIQVRLRVDETGGADGTTMDDWTLQYSKNGGTYTNVPTSDSGDGIRAATAGLTNDAATTNRATNGISDGSGTFDAGGQSTDGVVNDILLTANDFTELVWGVEFVAANVADTDTFDFQISEANAHSSVPRVTIAKSAQPVTASAPKVDFTITAIDPLAAGQGPASAGAPEASFSITPAAPEIIKGVNEKPANVDFTIVAPDPDRILAAKNEKPPVVQVTLSVPDPTLEAGSFQHDAWEDLVGRWEEYCQKWPDLSIDLASEGVTLTITAVDPEVDAGVNQFPAEGSLSISAITPLVLTGVNSFPGAVQILINPFDPEVDAGVALFPDRVQINLAAFAPEVDTGVNLQPSKSSITLDAKDPFVHAGVNQLAGASTLNINALDPLGVFSSAIIKPGTVLMSCSVPDPTLTAAIAVAAAKEYRLHRGKSVGGTSVSDPTKDVGSELVSNQSNADL